MMNYILIDYEKFTLFHLQSILTLKSEVYLFLDCQSNTSLPLSWLESFLHHDSKVHFVEIDKTHFEGIPFHWAFVIGQIIAKDQHAHLKILSDEKTFTCLSSLIEGKQMEWLSPSQTVEEKKEAPPADDNVSLMPIEESKPENPNEEIISTEPKEQNSPPQTLSPQESKKERLKKEAIIANEAEFTRFTTNYIFNLFATHLYLEKVTPPSCAIDLKNLLMTEYFPPEENFKLSEYTDSILENVFSRLEKKGFISFNGEQVHYHLSQDFIYQHFLQLIQQQQPKKHNGIIHLAKMTLFFLREEDENIEKIIEKAKSNGYFTIQNKKIIYPSNRHNIIPSAKNDDNQPQNLQLQGIRVKKHLSAHHPKISLLTPHLKSTQQDNDFQFNLALQLIKSPNRPKSIKNLKRFLAAKIATDSQGIEKLIKKLFKERYIIVSHGERITYRTELIRSSHYKKVVNFLKNGSEFKPKEEKALLNAVYSCLGGKISQAECQAIIKQLIDDRYITIEDGIATYQL